MNNKQQQPRGIRNNNPLNLRKSNILWKGKIRLGTDNEFEQFVDIFYGIRAAMVNMRTHIKQDAQRLIRCTVKREIARWAPPTENNTTRYVQLVCQRAELQPEDTLDFTNKQMICRLCHEMAYMECGVQLPMDYFEKSYEMAVADNIA